MTNFSLKHCILLSILFLVLSLIIVSNLGHNQDETFMEQTNLYIGLVDYLETTDSETLILQKESIEQTITQLTLKNPKSIDLRELQYKFYLKIEDSIEAEKYMKNYLNYNPYVTNNYNFLRSLLDVMLANNNYLDAKKTIAQIMNTNEYLNDSEIQKSIDEIQMK